MFLSSASVSWFATHLTHCIINFASQLTCCVIIFASHFSPCILIMVSNGPRGRLQPGGDAAGAGSPGAHRHWGRDTVPCCHLLLLFPDLNFTSFPSSAPLQPCPSSFHSSCFILCPRILGSFCDKPPWVLPCTPVWTNHKSPARHPWILCSVSTKGLLLQDASGTFSDLE